MVTTCGFRLPPYSFPLPPASMACLLLSPLLLLRTTPPPTLPASFASLPHPGCLLKPFFCFFVFFFLPLDIMDSDQICASATLRKDFWDALGLEGQYFSQYS